MLQPLDMRCPENMLTYAKPHFLEIKNIALSNNKYFYHTTICLSMLVHHWYLIVLGIKLTRGSLTEAITLWVTLLK